MAFPSRVDSAIAEIKTIEEATDMLSKASAMEAYAKRLKGGIEIERPIALGVLKIKTKIGELCPPAKGGRGKKTSAPSAGVFAEHTVSAYRKLAKYKDKLEEYYEAIDDVPTQTDFIRSIEKPHVQKNSEENEWYTPAIYIEAARVVLNGIDLDPATSLEAQEIVQAEAFYTVADDGLEKTWKGSVWMNPPYSRDLIERFCQKLVDSYQGGKVTGAIALTNNATETGAGQLLLASADSVCFHRGRIKFHGPKAQKNSPLQGQMFCYFGKFANVFCEEFSKFGACLRGG